MIQSRGLRQSTARRHTAAPLPALQTLLVLSLKLRGILVLHVYGNLCSFTFLSIPCRQESASDVTDLPMRAHVPQSLPSPERASSLSEGPTGKTEATCRQQSSPAVLQAEDHRDDDERERKFQRCCLSLQNTDAINKWKNIGRFLGISDSIIDKLKKDEKETDEQFYQMMMTWWRKMGTDATPEKLIEALKETNLRNVIDKVIRW